MAPLSQNCLQGTQGSRRGVNAAPPIMPVIVAKTTKEPRDMATAMEKISGEKPEKINSKIEQSSNGLNNIQISRGISTALSAIVNVTVRIDLVFSFFSKYSGMLDARIGPNLPLKPHNLLSLWAATPFPQSWGRMTSL